MRERRNPWVSKPPRKYIRPLPIGYVYLYAQDDNGVYHMLKALNDDGEYVFLSARYL